MPDRQTQRILILGGTENQLPVIEEAHRRGFITVVADNNPQNPGHQLASESYLLSTTDSKALVSLGRELGISGVVAHGSDPAALSAAKIADELKLSGDELGAVELVQDKIRLRQLQRDLGLSVPEFLHARGLLAIEEFLRRFPGGIIVKPADGSGSRGVSRLTGDSSQKDVKLAFELSRRTSQSGRVIVEQLLPHRGIQMGGDVVFANGRIRQAFFTTQYMANRGKGLAVIANLIPTIFDKAFQKKAVKQLSSIICHAGLKQGVYNFEFLPDRNGLPVLVDFAARSGGGLYGELFAHSYGIDTISINLDFSLGLPVSLASRPDPNHPVLGITLHSLKSGNFRRVVFSPLLESLLVKRFIGLRPGDFVYPFVNSGHRVGMAVASSRCRHMLRNVAENVYDHVVVELGPN